MNIHGVGPSSHISPVAVDKKPANPGKPTASPSHSEAATAEISDEAKALSRRSGKANPHQVAEALGAKNFGQALKSLSEAGVDLNSGFVSDLVHGDEGALATAQAALAPPEPEESTTELPPSESEVSDPSLSGEPQVEPLVIDVSETNLEIPEVLPPQDDTSLLETLLEETSVEDNSASA